MSFRLAEEFFRIISKVRNSLKSLILCTSWPSSLLGFLISRTSFWTHWPNWHSWESWKDLRFCWSEISNPHRRTQPETLDKIVKLRFARLWSFVYQLRKNASFRWQFTFSSTRKIYLCNTYRFIHYCNSQVYGMTDNRQSCNIMFKNSTRNACIAIHCSSYVVVDQSLVVQKCILLRDLTKILQEMFFSSTRGQKPKTVFSSGKNPKESFLLLSTASCHLLHAQLNVIAYIGSFLSAKPPSGFLTENLQEKVDRRLIMRRKDFTHAQVNCSQLEKILFMRGQKNFWYI